MCKFLVFGLFEDEFWWGIMCVVLMLLSVILVFMVLKFSCLKSRFLFSWINFWDYIVLYYNYNVLNYLRFLLFC